MQRCLRAGAALAAALPRRHGWPCSLARWGARHPAHPQAGQVQPLQWASHPLPQPVALLHACKHA